MSNATDFSTEQLAAARSNAWHQAGTPLLTLDALRDFVTASGIVLFAPRPLQLPAPAPSLVEAMIGSPSAGPTDGQIATTRSIVARLVAEGNALPLNLLGMPGDLPDFVVSAQVENEETRRTRIAASIACHAAIKVNMPLEPAKIDWLLRELGNTEHPTSCPHGRPIALRYSLKDIQRAFQRI